MTGLYHPPFIASIITPGGSSAYHADAVHWDGTSYLGNATLSCGSHNKWSFAVWFKMPVAVPARIGGFFIINPAAFNFGYSECDGYDPPSAGFGGMQFTLIDVDGTTYLAVSNNVDNDATGKATNDIWYAFMASADCSTDTGPITVYLDDVDASGRVANLGGPSAVFDGNGVPMRVGTADPGGDNQFDMANFMMWYGPAVDWSQQSNRRKIIDANGKPVNPSTAVSAFGTPTVMMTGDATAFQTNQGTGGAFTLTGSLTNASTSPSD